MAEATNKLLPIIGGFNKQRFTQFGSEDAANFYIVADQTAKNSAALYPTLGRHIIGELDNAKLQFNSTVRAFHWTARFLYVVIANEIYRVDTSFNATKISTADFQSSSGDVYTTDLSNQGGETFVCFSDGGRYFVYSEVSNTFTWVNSDPTLNTISPGYLATFGNRIVVADLNTSQYFLSAINLPENFDTADGVAPLNAFEESEIKGFAVLHNTLYIFTPFSTSVWSNQSTVFYGTNNSFPFKKNTSYAWDYGLTDWKTVDTDFGMIVWLAQTKSGLVQVMASSGGPPKPINDQAIDVLLQSSGDIANKNVFLSKEVDGFLYQYENNIFYRLSAGREFVDSGNAIKNEFGSLEYNFQTDSWHRVTELDGGRNRIQKHAFFNTKHIVSVIPDMDEKINGVPQIDGTLYEMSGRFYTNDIRNYESDEYDRVSFRYLRETPVIYEKDYAEFDTRYVQIDFVFGDGGPQNFEFNPIDDPTIELLFSDDGGVSFNTADAREFSQLGTHQWRMRWYELGSSRNRVYKLHAISSTPIVILGGIMKTRRVSGGAD